MPAPSSAPGPGSLLIAPEARQSRRAGKQKCRHLTCAGEAGVKPSSGLELGPSCCPPLRLSDPPALKGTGHSRVLHIPPAPSKASVLYTVPVTDTFIPIREAGGAGSLSSGLSSRGGARPDLARKDPERQDPNQRVLPLP